MVKLSAGNEVLAYCGKCKLKLAHTIVVMKTDEIPDKVTCNTCKSTHAFKEKATRKRITSSKGRGKSPLHWIFGKRKLKILMIQQQNTLQKSSLN